MATSKARRLRRLHLRHSGAPTAAVKQAVEQPVIAVYYEGQRRASSSPDQHITRAKAQEWISAGKAYYVNRGTAVMVHRPKQATGNAPARAGEWKVVGQTKLSHRTMHRTNQPDTFRPGFPSYQWI